MGIEPTTADHWQPQAEREGERERIHSSRERGLTSGVGEVKNRSLEAGYKSHIAVVRTSEQIKSSDEMPGKMRLRV